jgi:hypothetical protein
MQWPSHVEGYDLRNITADFAAQSQFDNCSSLGIVYVPQKNLRATSESVETNN